MQIKKDMGSWRVGFFISKSKQIKGVNSKLDDDKHFVMWDFDETALYHVRGSLLQIQREFGLSNIYILSTGITGYYHAYCFTRVAFPVLVQILVSTKFVDWAFVSIGVMRKYFTLRIVPKGERKLEHEEVIYSHVEPTVNPKEIKGFVNYWTKRI